MKKVLYPALALAIAATIGCTKKNEDGTTEVMSVEEVAEKTQETAVQITEKTAEVTKKAEEVTKTVSEKTTAAVGSLTVKTEEVMSDLNSSVEEIKQKVAGFDKAQVFAYANEYKNVILQKKDQVAALTAKVKDLSVMELAGEKGKELKTQLSQHTDQFRALKERYVVYYNKLEEMGYKMSEFDLSSLSN